VSIRLGCCLVFIAAACTSQPAYRQPQTAPAAPAVTAAEQTALPGSEIEAPPAPLTAAETQAAASIALRALETNNLRGSGPLFFVHAEMLHDKAAPNARRALVEHYRYDGDLTITTLVDLGAQRVVAQRTAAHVPTPLSREEFEQARASALGDSRVSGLLAAHRNEQVDVEPMMTFTTSPDDPFFGHRVVRLLFRVGRDYLHTPLVFVDLTDNGRVLIQEPPVPQPRM